MHIGNDLTTPLHNRACLWRSVHRGAQDAKLQDLPGQDDLRKLTADFILSHPYHPAVRSVSGSFEINTEDGTQNMTVEEYCDWLKLPGSYGSDLEVLILAVLLEVDITLFSVRRLEGVLELHGMAPDDIFRWRGDSAEHQSAGSLPLARLYIARTGAGKRWDMGHFDTVLPWNRRASQRRQKIPQQVSDPLNHNSSSEDEAPSPAAGVSKSLTL